MDSSAFDRIARTLASSTARRGAVRGIVGAGLAAAALRFGADVDAKRKRRRKKKKNKNGNGECRQLRDTCGDGATCCGQSEGESACRVHVKAICDTLLEGDRCCGVEGTVCDPNAGDCDCCDNLVCAGTEIIGVFACKDPS